MLSSLADLPDDVIAATVPVRDRDDYVNCGGIVIRLAPAAACLGDLSAVVLLLASAITTNTKRSFES